MICELSNKLDSIMIKILWFDIHKEFEVKQTETSLSYFINTSVMFVLSCLLIVWWWIPGCILYELCCEINDRKPFAFLYKKKFKCGKKMNKNCGRCGKAFDTSEMTTYYSVRYCKECYEEVLDEVSRW